MSQPTTSTHALARTPSSTGAHDEARVPLSVRHPWHRVSLLGTLVALLALPWMTSTGCAGDQPPVTETGFQLLAQSIGDEPLFMLAPLALIAAALLGVVAPAIGSAARRFGLSFAMLALVVGGAFFVFVGVFGPRASEHVQQHFASWAGIGALVALIVDALVRFMLGARELWVARRSRR